jgi:VanZ family protein
MRPFSNRLIHTAFYRLPAVALYVAIFWQSSYPGIIKASLFPYDDKVFHFFIFGLLALLTARWVAADRTDMKPAKIRLIAMAASCLYGLSDEIHQAFVPARTASAADVAADCIGSIAGAWAYIHLIRDTVKQES